MASGNFMVDWEDREQDQKPVLECGCKGRCRCDDDDEVVE